MYIGDVASSPHVSDAGTHTVPSLRVSRGARPPRTPSRTPSCPRLLRLVRVLGVLGAVLLLSACDLFDGRKSPSAIPRPSTLTPEADMFRDTDLRTYTWLEELRRDGKSDSVLGLGSFRITYARDTLVSGSLRPFFDVSASFTVARPAPASFLTRLGVRADRVHVDTTRVPDPGPAYRFPEDPGLGWRLDTIVNDLRFVRLLNRMETISQAGVRHETWAFAESTWWAGTPVLLGTGTTWMGRTGLVRHQSLWPGYASGTGVGTLVRTLSAP